MFVKSEVDQAAVGTRASSAIAQNCERRVSNQQSPIAGQSFSFCRSWKSDTMVFVTASTFSIP